MEVELNCVWCGSAYKSKRCTSKVCSTKCSNDFHNTRKRDWNWLTTDEFYTVIDNWVAQGDHPNPAHPINVETRATAEFYRALTTLVNATTNLLKEENAK